MTSPEPADADRGRRMLFALAMIVFAAWAVGLGVLAFTTAEKPRPAAAVPR